MYVKMFNFWYFFWIFLSIACYVGLYFLLKNKSNKTKNIVLFSILVLALVMHFTKAFYPPYSTNKDYFLKEVFFVNICGANILFFPFMYFSKNQKTRDYMFYMGLISGFASICYPTVALFKDNPLAEWMDIVRYYVHHSIIWIVPLLMVTLKLHKPSYKSMLSVPTYLMGVLIFVMANQIIQSEIGIISLRNNNFLI
ncbi:MAG: YwaF family protein [Clostridia bacterium]|nr:YwaF family protein [Clostridia bacterium]